MAMNARPLALLLFALPACNEGVLISTTRTGPQFATAFPDSSVLVQTEDPDAVRDTLSNVVLPETQVHHDHLLALLRAEQTISPAHLNLLIEAVALPEGGTTFIVNGVRSFYPQRGVGKFAPVVDKLLVEGADKLVALDRTWLGHLLGKTHSDEALFSFADRFVPELDDGSDTALAELLRGFQHSPALIPFLTDYMAPKGRLEGERAWAAFEHVPFDEARMVLVGLIAERSPQLTAQDLHRAMQAMAFDEGRSKTAQVFAAKLTGLQGSDLLQAVGTCSFDQGRTEVLTALVKTLDGIDTETAVQLISKPSFDAGRLDALAILIEHADFATDHAGLARLIGIPSFDDGRTAFVEHLAPKLRGEADGNTAKAILSTFSFDAGRTSAVRLLADSWRSLPSTDRDKALQVFSFDSAREEAAALLDR